MLQLLLLRPRMLGHRRKLLLQLLLLLLCQPPNNRCARQRHGQHIVSRSDTGTAICRG